MIYLKTALAALQASGLVAQLIAATVAAAALLAAYGVWHHQVYRSGYVRALADIAAEDTRAIGHATDLRKIWRACRDRGGRWIQSEGRCG
ncbi:hypothetical protein [Bradyrhizobium japonicum]|uniref:hypothetical protein n=1 Tax=Bradyrhizobium japonicum TaxID=375 RepID=UPI0004B943D9|nr:hypothetical protein [Bradyrhizobium japonicum]MCD9819806.1 hypothetical protein [Bradyrhizobium japonicum]MEB2675149.1 hypothetical protein [Bradyrhizobium japonicum]WLB25022.1 hypothetical protein QIH85_24395 [Bradyrhizobium japonicum]WRI85526.1 hypothetical protein R3F75_26460 [Bradyrhizobium japonicum]